MSAEIVFPEHYKGLFQRTQAVYGPMIREALCQIKRMDVPDMLRPSLAYQVWENPQPSFILLPFTFLATAEAAGGITEAHRAHLPMILLMAEFCAVADDTIDRAPTRSGRETFSARFGDASAVPFACALSSLVFSRSRHSEPLFQAAETFFIEFYGLELWERENIYPSPRLFGPWLQNRYQQATIANEYALNCAAFLSGLPRVPRTVIGKLASIGQDVDDIVNLVEYRAAHAENDDLQCGIVTRPLILAVEQVPRLAYEVSAMWDYYRPLCARQLPIHELLRERGEVLRKVLPIYQHIRRVILDRGVPPAVRQSLADFRSGVRATPAPLRSMMRDLMGSYLDRLRRCTYAEVEELA
jgi:hypothetical protein